MMLKGVLPTLLSALLVVTTTVSADDTEIFFPRTVDFEYAGTGVAPPNPNYPNVLFVLDASWSMNHSDKGYAGNRISRLRQAMSIILNSAEGVNIGLMRFSNNESGARVIYPMSPIEHAREDAKTVINNMGLDWYTPTVGALIESGFYWTGAPVHFGRTRYAKPSSNHRNLKSGRISHPDSYTGGTVVRDPLCTDANPDDPACIEERIDGDATYISPVVSECQKNYQVLINDGGASGFGSKAVAENFLEASCANAGDNTCAVELAKYIATQDIAPHLPGDSHVTTYTVGFNASIDALRAIAVAGGGEYFESSSAEQLATALSAVLVEAVGGNRSFSAPAITMDQTTRLSHRDDIYVALFQPEAKQRWSGNLKRYRFDGALLDKNGEVALDAAGGAIKGNAQSYWSDIADGNVVTDGGAANRLDNIVRRVTTFTGAGSNALTDAANALSELNTNITAEMLNVPAGEMSNLLKWARGVDVDDNFPGDMRSHMGDPLHSRPAILSYGVKRSETAVFVGTNEGYLHAIDAATGNEIFSFVPPELLGTLNEHYQNPVTTNRTYGVDGDLTLWVDESLNGAIDHAYLYMGMRRGGRNYTALDVTNPSTPKYLWSINAGDAGFEKLGQTWSKPTLGTIELNGEVTKVLIFGGGYDPRQDNLRFRSADTMGNDLYIVNAETGALLWSTANDSDSYVAMDYSIPSDVSVVDTDSDGLTDQIYVGDMGGQVWRFDIDNLASGAIPSVTGGVIAELASDNRDDFRRFFNRPDISLVSDGDTHFLSVAIGSGARSQPLYSGVKNQFFMIRQHSIYGAPEGYGVLDEEESNETTIYRAITEFDLYDATENLVDSTNVEIANDARLSLDELHGWRLYLQDKGEKSLAPSLTLNHQVIFTTYLPNARTGDPCAPAIGGGRTYTVNVFDASPSTGSELSDRYTMLETLGIPPEPVPHINSDGDVQIIVGVEIVDTPDIDLTRRIYWTEQPDY